MKDPVVTSVLSASSSRPSSSPESTLPANSFHVNLKFNWKLNLKTLYPRLSYMFMQVLNKCGLNSNTVGSIFDCDTAARGLRWAEEIKRQVTSLFSENEWTAGRPSPSCKWQEREVETGRKEERSSKSGVVINRKKRIICSQQREQAKQTAANTDYSNYMVWLTGINLSARLNGLKAPWGTQWQPWHGAIK